MRKLTLDLFQILIDDKTTEIGFEKNIILEENKNKRKFTANNKYSILNITSLFGKVNIKAQSYYNKTLKKSLKTNCVNYIENDRISPVVKKRIVKLTPFDFFVDANEKLYELTGINISVSTMKRVTNNIAKQNNKWLEKLIKHKNKQSYEENIVINSERIVISNDGGRFKKINSEKKMGRKSPKNPEWKEAKAGIVFEIDENGKKINKSYFYGKFEKKWSDLEENLKYIINRFNIIKCKQYETISDNGNGLKQMYVRIFGEANNKIYFDLSDFFHTIEHLVELGKIIYPNKNNAEETSEECGVFIKNSTDILIEKGGEKLLDFFRLEAYDNKLLKNNYDKNIGYFKNNYKRMDYHISIKNKLPIGTGDMEASIKKLINKRFKRNNIYWLTDNANNLFRLSCTILNKEFNQFWGERNNKNSWFDFKKTA
jgi:hypothetical protein